MRELAVQAATDTLNDNDRSSIDLEFQSLKDELTRIANVTEYNGMNVLNGTYQEGGGSEPTSLFSNQNNTANYNQAQPGTNGYSDPHGDAGGSHINSNGPHDDIRGHWRLQIGADNDINNQHEFSVMNATAKGLDLNVEHYANSLGEFTDAIKGGLDVYVDDTSGKFVGKGAGATKLTVDDSGASDVLKAGAKTITDIGFNSSHHWVASDEIIGGAASTFSDAIAANDDIGGNHGLSYQLSYYDANVRDVNAARSAVTRLDHAIDEINRERSYVGSEQNKLQFTMSNLSSNIQSIESARSSIEDVDFAAEAADLAKNQILAQSGTAMLAQAATISQNILGLLA
jgi:flagellin